MQCKNPLKAHLRALVASVPFLSKSDSTAAILPAKAWRFSEEVLPLAFIAIVLPQCYPAAVGG